MGCPSCGHGQLSPESEDGPFSTTHDTSSVACHIDLPDWLAALNISLQAAWPKRHVRYAKVAVLMLSWHDTDMQSASSELKRLENVFRQAYNYKVDHWKIPSVNPDLEVHNKVYGFVREYGQPDHLLIVYYAGHARPGSFKGAPPIWQPRRKSEDGKEIDTAGIQSLLSRAQAQSPDVLLLHDCCYSLYAHPSNTKSSRAVVECLFAGGFESQVPIAGPDSFTAALIEELLGAIRSRRPLSVTELHRRIICRLQSLPRRAIFNSDDSLRKTKQGDIAFTQDSTITPAHLFLSVNEQPRPIVLSPTTSSDMSDPSHTLHRLGPQESSDLWPKVLISVRLRKDGNIENELRQWLLAAPKGVVDFKGIFPSYSTLLLVELPLAVWDLLPPHPAISFVGFTTKLVKTWPHGRDPKTDSLSATYSVQNTINRGEVHAAVPMVVRDGGTRKCKEPLETSPRVLPTFEGPQTTPTNIPSSTQDTETQDGALARTGERIMLFPEERHSAEAQDPQVTLGGIQRTIEGTRTLPSGSHTTEIRRLLNVIDRLLPYNLSSFKRLGMGAGGIAARQLVVEVAKILGNDPETHAMISRHKEYLLRYINARELIENGDRSLNIRRRLQVLSLYQYRDEEAFYTSSDGENSSIFQVHDDEASYAGSDEDSTSVSGTHASSRSSLCHDSSDEE